MSAPRALAAAVLAAALLAALTGCHGAPPPDGPPIDRPPYADADALDAALRRKLAAGEVAAAVASWEGVAAARERADAGRPLAFAAWLDEVADLFFYAPGATAEAWEVTAQLLRRSLAVRERTLGAEEPAVADALSNLATLEYYRGRWDAAEALDRRAFELRRRLLGDASPQVAASRRDLAMVAYHQGRYRDAAPQLEQALAVLEAAPDAEPADLVRTLNALAEVYRAQGRYDEAEERFRRALALAAADGYGGDAHAVLRATVHGNLGLMLKDEARYDEAEPQLAAAVRLLDAAAAGDPYELLNAWHNQAELYRLQGRFDEARPRYERASERARELLGDDNPRLALFLNQRAVLAAEEERYVDAEALYGEVAALLARTAGPGHPLLAQTLHDHAALRCRRRDFAVADELYGRALAIRETALGESHPETALTLGELARCRFTGGAAAAEVRPLVERALAIFAATSAYPREEAETRALAAELAEREGRLDVAVAVLAEALRQIEELRPQTGGSEDARAGFLRRYVGYFNRMVAWQLRAGDVDRALEYAERVRARVLLDQLATSRVDLRAGIDPAALAPLAAREARVKSLLAEFQARLRFTAERTDLDDGERRRATAELEREIETVTLEYQQVVGAIRDLSPLWREMITAGGEPATRQAIQRDLVPADGLLLLYQLGEDGGYLFAVPPAPAAVDVYPLRVPPAAAAVLGVAPGPLSAPALERALAGTGDSFGDSFEVAPSAPLLAEARGLAKVGTPTFPTAEPAEPDEPPSVALFHALWQALLPAELRPRLLAASEVVVVPDGALHALPFEALVVTPAASVTASVYWLDRGPVVRYAASATALYNLERRGERRDAPSATDGPPSLLIVADPVFDRDATPAVDSAADSAVDSAAVSRRVRAGLARLPGTAREAAAIGEVWGVGAGRTRVVTLAGEAARESAVRAALADGGTAGRRVVHFATHGLVDARRSELLAALALTPPAAVASSDDDGLLQLFEIYELDLDADLAVLSACESHLGRRVEGEGVFALSRGFLAAGARRVVASQWPVNDASTAELMAELYRRLAAGDEGAGAGVDVGRALRDARLAIRRDPRWASPYFWAPFVLTGAR